MSFKTGRCDGCGGPLHLGECPPTTKLRALVHDLVALLEKSHRVDQHNPYSLRELNTELFARIDEAMKGSSR